MQLTVKSEDGCCDDDSEAVKEVPGSKHPPSDMLAPGLITSPYVHFIIRIHPELDICAQHRHRRSSPHHQPPSASSDLLDTSSPCLITFPHSSLPGSTLNLTSVDGANANAGSGATASPTTVSHVRPHPTDSRCCTYADAEHGILQHRLHASRTSQEDAIPRLWLIGMRCLTKCSEQNARNSASWMWN
jgi:hypothetical protein